MIRSSPVEFPNKKTIILHYGQDTNLFFLIRDLTPVARIAAYPEGWSIARGNVRKCLLHKFPYKLLYAVDENHILIIAVAHQHRKPDYWFDKHET